MKTKSKILFLGSLPPPHHGVCIVNENILRFWDDHRYNLIFVDISDRRISIDNIGKFDLINIFLAIKHLFIFLYYLKKDAPEVIVMNLSQGFWGFTRDSTFIISCYFLSKAKIICRFPGGDFFRFYNSSNYIIKLFIKYTLRLVSLILTEGNAINLQFKKINPFISVFSIPTGIPDSDLYVNNKDERNFNLLFLANHRKEKGFFDVLYILPEIKKMNGFIRVYFVGEMSFSKKELVYINNYVRENGLETVAKFCGIQIGKKKAEYFRHSHAQVLPSYTEGLPASILEGLAAGLPIIATNIGVIPEVIEDGINGFLFSPGDREALKRHILYLAENRQFMKEMSACNRLYYDSKFRIERFINELKNSIESVLNN